MVAIRFNPAHHEPKGGGGGGYVVPEGWYEAIITETDMKRVKDKQQNIYLLCKTHFRDLQRDIDIRFNLFNDNPEAVRIANNHFSLLCHVLGLSVGDEWDSSMLHNRPFQVFAQVKEGTDSKGNKRTQNEFNDFRYTGGQDFARNPGNAPHGNPQLQNGGAAPPGFGAPPAMPTQGQPGPTAAPPYPPQQPPPGYPPQGQPPAQPPAYGGPPQGQPPQQPWGQGQPPGQPPQAQQPYAPPGSQPVPYPPPNTAQPPQTQPPAYGGPPQGQPPAYGQQPGQPPFQPPQGGAPAWSGPQ